jgi:hypothetical protein
MWKENYLEGRATERSCVVDAAFSLKTDRFELFLLSIRTGHNGGEMVPNWYLRCRELNVEKVDLCTGDIKVAKIKAMKYLRKWLKQLLLDLEEPFN